MECLVYAKERYKTLTGRDRPTFGNTPEEYWANAQNTYPHARAVSIAVWKRNDGGIGHVGIVEEVYSNGHVKFSDANRDWKGTIKTEYDLDTYDLGRLLGSGYTFLGYIAE